MVHPVQDDWYIQRAFFMISGGSAGTNPDTTKMKTQNYLLKNKFGIYHFRRLIPLRFRHSLQQREIKRSLHTKNHTKALREARRYAVLTDL